MNFHSNLLMQTLVTSSVNLCRDQNRCIVPAGGYFMLMVFQLKYTAHENLSAVINELFIRPRLNFAYLQFGVESLAFYIF